jgi:hypothetical protein
MAKNVKKFVNRQFIRTVDLDLLGRLLKLHVDRLSFDFDGLSRDDKERREALFEFFRSADESFPSQLLDALHEILVLSNPNGVRILREQADRAGVELIPATEIEGEEGGRHLTPRHIALRAYLDRPAIFERALDLCAFIAPPSPMEFAGIREGEPSRHQDIEAREAFRAAASEYFSERYLGRYCDVRWYTDEEEVSILVLHGKNMVTANVEQEGEERVLSFREIRQDTIRYHAPSGRLRTSAQYAPEKKKLAELFAEHLLGEPGFFDGEDSQNLYTLEPINEAGAAFRFRTEWDDELERLHVIEVQVDEGERTVDGRTRHPRWAMTVRDNQNAIARLAETVPDLDLGTARINYLKVEFTFKLNGKPRRIMVKIKPPGLVCFRRDVFEDRIMEHLRRNGLCIPRQPDTVAVAAE